MRVVNTQVLIIGSGFGAAAPALRLAQAGLDVVVLEKGPRIAPSEFRQTQDPEYFLRYHHRLEGDGMTLRYVEGLGGGSGFYEMASFRAPSLAFEQSDHAGHALWPTGIDRAALDPHYETAEHMLNVQQVAPGEVPKNGLLLARMLKNLGYSCDRARHAARGCLGSGFCLTGCIYGAKQSLLLNYLPQAEAAGAVIECGVQALAIRPMVGGYAVDCAGADGEVVAYSAPTVLLGAGTIGTARLLLASRGSLPGLSDQLGHNIVDNGCTTSAALLPDHLPDGDLFTGRSHAGVISYAFLASHGLSLFAEKPLPLQIVTAARFLVEDQPEAVAWWGRRHMDLMERLRTRCFVVAALGFAPPVGHLSLGRGGKVRLRMHESEALQRYLARAEAVFSEVLGGNGCKPLRIAYLDDHGRAYARTHLATAHQMGSARMADDPALGVTDGHGEVFGYPGLFVTDGSAIPSSLAVNPSLTILANAERIAAELVGRLGRSNATKPARSATGGVPC